MKIFARVTAVLGVVLACASPARAQAVNTFMLVPNIPGGSIDDAHRDWIDVQSLSQGWEDAKKLNSCDVSLIKPIDIAGPKLWAAAVNHQALGEVKIEIVKSGGDRPKVYEIRLTNAHVSRINTAFSGAGYAEAVTLTGDGATLTVFTQKPDGSFGGSVTATVPCAS